MSSQIHITRDTKPDYRLMLKYRSIDYLGRFVEAFDRASGASK